MSEWDTKGQKPYTPGSGKAPSLPSADCPLESDDQIDHWAFLLGLKLHNSGFFWEAHEVWESLWRLQSGPAKSFLKILIQLTAAHLKIRTGDREAADRLIESLGVYLKDLSQERREICGFSLNDLRLKIQDWAHKPHDERGILLLSFEA